MNAMRWALVALAAVVLVGAAVLVWQALQSAGRRASAAALDEVAAALGAAPANQIARLELCWDLNTHCGTVHYFTTQHSEAEVTRLVADLGLAEVLTRQTDGRGLFTDLNISGPYNLTVDGQDGSRLAVPASLMPPAFEWWLERDGRNLFVTFYALDPERDYVIEGRRLTGNVVRVMLQTK